MLHATISLIYFFFLSNFIGVEDSNEMPASESIEVVDIDKQNESEIPLKSALERVTKKSFGTYVTPTSSPVSPEVFTGYHTGVDFEILDEEEDIEIYIFSVCEGPVIYKNYVGGYGGVMIQACQLDQQDVTVLYGHLKFDRILPEMNQFLKQGDEIGILGQAYSQETSGERKHLHLAIHKGSEINLKGYVQTESELSDWVDPLLFIE